MAEVSAPPGRYFVCYLNGIKLTNPLPKPEPGMRVAIAPSKEAIERVVGAISDAISKMSYQFRVAYGKDEESLKLSHDRYWFDTGKDAIDETDQFHYANWQREYSLEVQKELLAALQHEYVFKDQLLVNPVRDPWGQVHEKDRAFKWVLTNYTRPFFDEGMAFHKMGFCKTLQDRFVTYMTPQQLEPDWEYFGEIWVTCRALILLCEQRGLFKTASMRTAFEVLHATICTRIDESYADVEKRSKNHPEREKIQQKVAECMEMATPKAMGVDPKLFVRGNRELPLTSPCGKEPDFLVDPKWSIKRT